MRILVAGLGAVGAVFAVHLKAAGHQVAGLEIESVAGAMRGKTIHSSGVLGERSALLDEIATSPAGLGMTRFDLIIVAVKTTASEEVLETLRPLLVDMPLVFFAQNGLGDFDALSSFVPRERILLSQVSFAARKDDPTHVVSTSLFGATSFGSKHNLVPAPALRRIEQALCHSGIPSHVSSDIMRSIWSKLLINASFNALGGILGATCGRIGAMGETRELICGIVTEAFQVMQACGESSNWDSPESFLNHFFGEIVELTSSHYPSTYYDLAGKRRTEIGNINGAIVRQGKKLGIPTHVNEVLATLVRAKEAMLTVN